MRSNFPHSLRPHRGAAAGLAAGTVAAGLLLAVPPAAAVSSDVVISEVYGAGGNSGAELKQDFIELYNRGAAPVSLEGWSVQYASASGTNWNPSPLTATIEPGGYYLVGEGFGSAGTIDLPAQDAVDNTAMSGTAGKVALATVATALTCGANCATDPSVHDFVGYGSTASDFEGTGPALYSSSTTSSTSRDPLGTDTDDNAADFDLITPPSPTNAAGETVVYPPPLPCDGATPSPAAIDEIQGAGHLSPLDGTCIETTGVTTAVASDGYWLQTPDAESDGSQITSSGIFVYTGSGAVLPVVGDALDLVGVVDEYRPGSATGTGLKITEITDAVFTVTASGVPLPVPVRIGAAGVLPPADVIDNDSDTRIDVELSPEYQPEEDAIDWYEQFEGMLIEVLNPTAVSPTNDFGEIVVLPRGHHDYIRTPFRGVVYSGYDSPNPRRLLLDDRLIASMPLVNTGDVLLGAVTGPLDYGFSNYRMYPTTVPATVAGPAERETTLAPRPRQVSVASFNVENLDPTDSPESFAALADIVVDNLQAPDVLALEEVQDNTGPVNDGVVAADETLAQLVAAITAAGGPAYGWRQIDPANNADGGEPGGNIRVAFLFRTDRGLTFVDRASGDATTPTHPVLLDGEVALDHSPGRVDPTNPAWDATRKPLAGEFEWYGEKLFIVANHFSSKGGDDPLFGRWQPPTRSSEEKRHLQAALVNGFVDEILALDPDANVVVAGDINDFEFSETLDILTGDHTVLADLITYLPPSQRYTYVFDGNSQVLDHILVSPALAPTSDVQRPVRVRRDYDVVHVNADFHDQASDHDPQVVRLRLDDVG